MYKRQRHCWGGWSVYAAAKAGVLNFTKGLYVELQPYGIRATCIIPAAASTGFQKAAGIPEENQTLKPDDIADAIFYAATVPSGVTVEEMTVWGTSVSYTHLDVYKRQPFACGSEGAL